MTFPQTVLPLLVELYLDSVWTDITSYVRRSEGVNVKRGRSDEAGLVDASSCQMTLDNTDGRFSIHNPVGAYYGLIGRNTPIRVSIPSLAANGASYMLVPDVDNDSGGASTPDSAALSITGDIDIRVDIDGDWFGPDIAQGYNLIGKYVLAGNQRSWLLKVIDGALKFRWSADGSSEIVKDSTVDLPTDGLNDGVGRLAVRVTLDVNNGAAGNTVTFYTADTIDGPWTQLGAPVVTAGTTSIFNSTASVEIGADVASFGSNALPGRYYAAEIYQGIAGTLRADPDFRTQTHEDTSFADGQGNTWTINSDASIVNPIVYRFHGEVPSWTKSADLTGTDVYTQIEAAGILRRLGQGDPVDLPGYKDYLVSTDPFAYWALDEGKRKHEGVNSSAYTTSEFQLKIQANFTFGQGDLGDTLPAGLKLVTTVTEVSAGIDVGLPNSVTGYAFDYVWKSESPGSFYWGLVGNDDSQYFVLFRHNGTDNDIQILYQDPDTGAISTLGSTGVLTIFDDSDVHHIRFQVQEDGSDVDWTVYVDGTSEASGTQSSKAVKGLDRFGIFYDPGEGTGVNDVGTDPIALGHVGVWSLGGQGGDPPALADVMNVLSGYDGETAGARIQRVAADASIAVSFVGDLADTERMGPQVNGQNPLSIIRDCEAVDLGILYEDRESTSLIYRTRKSLYSQTSAFSGDYEAHEFSRPLDPIADDQAIRNDITASMPNGGTVQVELEEGALSTQDPPNGVGIYRTSVDLNVQGDGQLAPQANWRLALGTQDEPRYPALGFNLAHEAFAIDTAQTAALASLDIGDRLAITNPPTWVSPDDVTQLAQGFTEYLANFEWTIDVNAVPSDVYDVAVFESAVGTDTYKFDSGSSTLLLAVDSDDTTLSVQVGTTAGPVEGVSWTTSASERPFDIVIGGERMTVTNVVDTSGAGVFKFTFTVSRSVNGVVKSHSVGDEVKLADPARFGL